MGVFFGEPGQAPNLLFRLLLPGDVMVDSDHQAVRQFVDPVLPPRIDKPIVLIDRAREIF